MNNISQYYEFDLDLAEPLFKEGLWTIYPLKTKGKNGQVRKSVVTHMCRNREGSMSISFVNTNYGKCPSCKQAPPEAVQAVWKLHNWDDKDARR